jgi:hypothetical protein
MISRVVRRGILRVWLASLLLQATTTSAVADVVLLRNRSELKGTVVDRERVATHPEAFAEVCIELDSLANDALTPNPRHVPVADIQSLVLEDGGQRRVVDLTRSVSHGRRWGDTEAPDGHHSTRAVGIIMTSLGMASIAMGVYLKAAEESKIIVIVGLSATEIKKKNNDRPVTAFLVAGGALFVGGLVVLTKPVGRLNDSARVTPYSEDGVVGAQVMLYRH